uniref:Inner membrane protein n=1 Tax=Haemonchus contortus TaxID=6289 RepID=A0A7I5E754_HAECO
MSDRSAPDDGSDRERAKGQEGLSGYELFLVILGIFLLVESGVRLYFDFHFATIARCALLFILAALFIVGVCKKSSVCMCIAMIILTISLIPLTIAVVMLAIDLIGNKKELTTGTIISVVLSIVAYVCTFLACISTFVLRKQY